jgi:AcrR family transcriptional regulator
LRKVAPEYAVEYRDEARRKIVEVALQVFAENGHHETTMDEVAKRVGVSKGAIYLYFNSKEELFKEITERWREAQREILHSWFNQGELVGASENFFDKGAKEYKDDICLAFQLLSEATRNPSTRKVLKDNFEKRAAIIGEFLQEQKSKGVIKPEANVDALSIAVLAFFYGLQALLIIGVEESQLVRTSRDSMKAILGGPEPSTSNLK